MIIDNFRMIVKYYTLKKYLMNKLDYSEQTAKNAIAEIRKMDPEILHMFVVWFNGDISAPLPNKKINGITLQNIIDLNHVDPVSAFIDLNWIKEDPDKAKYYIAKPCSSISEQEITKDMKDELRNIAKKKGWQISESAENQSDIQIGE